MFARLVFDTPLLYMSAPYVVANLESTANNSKEIDDKVELDEPIIH